MLPAARTPRRQHRCIKAPLKLAFWSLALDRLESCYFECCAEAPDKSAPHRSACWNEHSWRLAAENIACPNRDSLKFPLRKSQPCRSSSSPFTPWKFRLGKDVCPPFNCRMSSSAVVGGWSATLRFGARQWYRIEFRLDYPNSMASVLVDGVEPWPAWQFDSPYASDPTTEITIYSEV